VKCSEWHALTAAERKAALSSVPGDRPAGAAAGRIVVHAKKVPTIRSTSTHSVDTSANVGDSNSGQHGNNADGRRSSARLCGENVNDEEVVDDDANVISPHASTNEDTPIHGLTGNGSSNPQIVTSRKKRRKAGDQPAVTRDKNDAFVAKVRGSKVEQGVAELIQMTTTPRETDRNKCTVLFHMANVKSSKARGGYHRGGDTEEEYSYEIITSDHRALRKAVIAMSAAYEYKLSGSVHLFDKHSNKDKFTVTYRIDEDDDDTNDPNYLSDKVKANQQIQIDERKKKPNEPRSREDVYATVSKGVGTTIVDTSHE